MSFESKVVGVLKDIADELPKVKNALYDKIKELLADVEGTSDNTEDASAKE